MGTNEVQMRRVDLWLLTKFPALVPEQHPGEGGGGVQKRQLDFWLSTKCYNWIHPCYQVKYSTLKYSAEQYNCVTIPLREFARTHSALLPGQ